MKKLTLLVCIIAITFSSVSCIGWESGVVSTKTDQNTENSIMSTRINQISNHKNVKIKAAINQVSLQKWVDGNNVSTYVTIEIENIGREKFKIEDIILQFISKEGKILKDTRNDNFCGYRIAPNVYPRVLYPGDIGYATEQKTIANTKTPEDIEKVDVIIFYTQTLQTKRNLQFIQNIEILPPYNIESSETEYNQTKAKVLINSSHILKDKFIICIALYDEKNHLLGISCKGYYIDKQPNPPKNQQLIFDFPFLNKVGLSSKAKTAKGFCCAYWNQY